MGLQTDRVFVAAIQADGGLTAMLAAGDVYNTAIALPDEDAENADLPYAIVCFDGAENNAQSKDDPYEGAWDKVRVSVEVAAKTRPELAEIAERIRRATHDYFAKNETEVEGYDFSASEVVYDPDKPCYWQTLHYSCETAREIV